MLIPNVSPGSGPRRWATRNVGSAGVVRRALPREGTGPKLLLQQVAEPKATKNRMHLDLEVPDIEAEADRLSGLGAQRVSDDTCSEHGSTWILMADPEGNEFCICDNGSPATERDDLMATRQEREANARFSQRYGEERGDAVHAIELAVIGGDWGANGYTTVAQADQLAAILALGTGSLLLDIGAGRGWPGLYLAATTGCSVVMTDVPAEGLAFAHGRGQHEGLSDRAWPVNASARDLPFPAKTFDAVVHTDVLC